MWSNLDVVRAVCERLPVLRFHHEAVSGQVQAPWNSNKITKLTRRTARSMAYSEPWVVDLSSDLLSAHEIRLPRLLVAIQCSTPQASHEARKEIIWRKTLVDESNTVSMHMDTYFGCVVCDVCFHTGSYNCVIRGNGRVHSSQGVFCHDFARDDLHVTVRGDKPNRILKRKASHLAENV